MYTSFSVVRKEGAPRGQKMVVRSAVAVAVAGRMGYVDWLFSVQQHGPRLCARIYNLRTSALAYCIAKGYGATKDVQMIEI